MQVYSVCTCMFMYTVQKFTHAHTVYCCDWLCVQIISICVLSMYKSVCYIGSWLQPNARWSTVYQFFLAYNAPKFLSWRNIFANNPYGQEEGVARQDFYISRQSREMWNSREYFTTKKHSIMVYDFDIPEEHLSMG